MLQPVYTAIGKGSQKFKMTPDCVLACTRVIESVKGDVGVVHINYEKTLGIAVDASLLGWGSILFTCDNFENDGVYDMKNIEISMYGSGTFETQSILMSISGLHTR